jgi:RNA polymerase sigma-70 factor, ECF subfamily
MPTQDYTIEVQQLFVKHQSAIRAFVLSLVPHFGEAEDVLQETFLTVTRKAAEFRQGSNFLAWACTIARLKVLEAQRQAAVHTFSPELIESLASSIPDQLIDERRLQAVAECFDRLAPRMRDLIRLRYHCDQLPGEISRTLDRSVNYVKVALTKARIAVRECVERSLRRQDAL